MALCLRIADAVQNTDPIFAETLRSQALKISTTAQTPGTARKPAHIDTLLSQIQDAWKLLDISFRTEVKNTDGLVGELGDILDTTRILFVFCSPSDETSLRVNAEFKIANELQKQPAGTTKLIVTPLPAATPTDFRRALLDGNYDIIHFAGHSDSDNLIFEDDRGNSSPAPLAAIGDLIEKSGNIKAVILNACNSVSTLAKSISPITIGMDDAIDDHAAIEFSRGFYDAIVRGKSVSDAYDEGISSVRMASYGSDQIRILSRGPTQDRKP